jgi:hypothetical protein
MYKSMRGDGELARLNAGRPLAQERQAASAKILRDAEKNFFLKK